MNNVPCPLKFCAIHARRNLSLAGCWQTYFEVYDRRIVGDQFINELLFNPSVFVSLNYPFLKSRFAVVTQSLFGIWMPDYCTLKPRTSLSLFIGTKRVLYVRLDVWFTAGRGEPHPRY